MKKLITIIAFASLLLMPLASHADVFATNNLAAATHRLVDGSKIVQSITLYSTNTSPTIVRIYDGHSNVYTNTAYTNFISYETNLVTSLVTTTGVTNNFTNTVLFTTPVVVAASTNNALTPLFTTVVPGSGTANVAGELITLTDVKAFAVGIALSNNAAGLSAIIQYRSP